MQKNLLRALSVFFSVFIVVLYTHSVSAFSGDKVSVFPEAGHKPFLQAIDEAQHTIDMAAYKFTDQEIIKALRRAADRNVKIKLLVENENIYKRDDIPAADQGLQDPTLLLRHPNIEAFKTSKRFSQSHYKMILVDGKNVLISTGNFCPDTFDEKYENPYRDFVLGTSDPASIAAIRKVFLADIADRRIVPDEGNIVWGPDQQREAYLRLLNRAQKSIDVYQQDIQDVGMAQAMAGAARAGVTVRLIMNPFPFGGKEDKNVPNQILMTEAGVKIVLCDKTYRVMHAKVVIIDGEHMYLGSCNFYPDSIDRTRELGKITKDPSAIATVMKTFEEDWKHGKPFVPTAKS